MENNNIPVQDVTPQSDKVAADTSSLIQQDIDLYKKHEKIYRRGGIKGVFQNIRIYSGSLLMLLYFLQPWLNWGDRQAVLFDLPARKFYIYGLTIWPQDLVLLSLLLMICAFGLFFITVFLGRVWCGYTCPQTAWTFGFMWIEELCEGSPNQRKKRDQQKLSLDKVLRKAAKHKLWIGYALVTAVTFVGYFSPIRELVINLWQLQLSSWELFWVGFFTLATYVNAGKMREQVCIYLCPYARFQAVMIDKNTLNVSYDFNRGEPRGHRKTQTADATQQESLGDCIDCHFCVQVCPTGIDIRDGLQPECIACAACIDACDNVMEKIGYEKGLVRYTTENQLEGKPQRLLRPRLIGYGITLIAMITIFALSIINRETLIFSAERDRGELYRITSNDLIENSYKVQIINKTQQAQTYKLGVSEQAFIWVGQQHVTLAPGEILDLPITLHISPSYTSAKHVSFYFQAQAVNSDQVTQTESRFIRP